VDAEHRRLSSGDPPSPEAPEPKKSLRMSAPLAEPVAFEKKEHAWQMTPRTTSQPTNLFWVMIEPLCA
jgi:hypothetical protein